MLGCPLKNFSRIWKRGERDRQRDREIDRETYAQTFAQTYAQTGFSKEPLGFAFGILFGGILRHFP